MEKNERNNSKYNKLKAGSLRRQTKLANLQPDSLIKKKIEINKIRNDKERLQQHRNTMQKCRNTKDNNETI